MPIAVLTLLESFPFPSRLFIYAKFLNISACGFMETFFSPSGA